MKHANLIAGGGVIATGYGFAAMSGYIAFDGLAEMTGLPVFGSVGPLTALGAASLGLATELKIKAREWGLAGICGLLCIGAGATDAYFGERSLETKAAARHQIHASALAAFTTADATTKAAGALIADREAQLAILRGDDVKAAQKLLGVIQDGRWGKDTTAAKQALEATFRSEIADARDDIRDAKPALEQGAPVAGTDKTLPPWMAIVVTIGAIVCSFLGSVIAFGLKPAPTKTEAELARDAVFSKASANLQASTATLTAVSALIRSQIPKAA